MRFWPVFMRNFLVWRKLAIPSLLGNIAEPLMWLAAFGYGLGSLVGAVKTPNGEVPYLNFVASGYICMSAMNAASFEALYSVFSRMSVQRTWDGILNAPILLQDIVLAELLWAAFKAVFSVSAIFGVMALMGLLGSAHVLLAWGVLILASVTFSAIALIFNALAKGYDFFTYYFTLFLTPMMCLSGVFFPREQLPPWLQGVSAWLPLSVVIDLFRPLFLGQWPPRWVVPMLLLLLYSVVAYGVALRLTQRRFKLA
jgi:lipooligosaccharide transport system permease protein